MIYAASYGGKISAINAHNGKLVWQQSFDPSGLLAASDVLYLSYNIPGTGNHAFLALRAKDSPKLWQQNFSRLNNFSRLTLLNGVSGLSKLNGDESVLYAFDAHNGFLRWNVLLRFGVIKIA